MKKTIAFAITLIGAACSISRGQVINTFPSWDGITLASPFGEPAVATVGQVFTVDPNFTLLNALAFGIENNGNAPVNFGLVLTEWDPVALHAVGGPLYFSGAISLPTSANTIIPLILPVSVQLTGNTQYVAFLTVSPFFDGIDDSAALAFVGSDVYTGGGAVFIDNGSDLTKLESAPWGAVSADLAFAAQFSAAPSAVPEPSAYGLAAAGLLLGVVGFKRRAKGTSRADR